MAHVKNKQKKIVIIYVYFLLANTRDCVLGAIKHTLNKYPNNNKVISRKKQYKTRIMTQQLKPIFNMKIKPPIYTL